MLGKTGRPWLQSLTLPGRPPNKKPTGRRILVNFWRRMKRLPRAETSPSVVILEAAMLTFDQLVAGFRNLGVEEGDTLLVHSSYKSFGEVEGGPLTVIRALEDALGAEGTLIMPTFNFDFNKGVPWDVRTTPSKMGILTELVRQDPRAKRVFHPFYSFAILGKH